GARGGAKIADYIEHEVSNNQLQLTVERFNCLGFCEQGPNLKIAPEGRFIHGVKIEALPNLMRELAENPIE
ncbi:MAG: (2Fe-2S) ferredoxin domain-containing protein, partial [Methylophilaceae bacterium]|nr:(2Fe-2S) ferredoxin domain-containing protein [Methylophilaceae bacterium]